MKTRTRKRTWKLLTSRTRTRTWTLKISRSRTRTRTQTWPFQKIADTDMTRTNRGHACLPISAGNLNARKAATLLPDTHYNINGVLLLECPDCMIGQKSWIISWFSRSRVSIPGWNIWEQVWNPDFGSVVVIYIDVHYNLITKKLNWLSKSKLCKTLFSVRAK